jgi:hypothetical protein
MEGSGSGFVRIIAPYPGGLKTYVAYGFFDSSVADPGSLSLTEFFHPGSASKNLIILFNPNKWFLSSRKYDPGCSSRIPDPNSYFLPIPDPGVKKAPDPGSRIRIRYTA